MISKLIVDGLWAPCWFHVFLFVWNCCIFVFVNMMSVAFFMECSQNLVINLIFCASHLGETLTLRKWLVLHWCCFLSENHSTMIQHHQDMRQSVSKVRQHVSKYVDNASRCCEILQLYFKIHYIIQANSDLWSSRINGRIY